MAQKHRGRAGIDAPTVSLGLERSNNRAGYSIKPFVIGLKNFLFCVTPGRVQSSAVLSSLIETAKENSLNTYPYLLWILEPAPELAHTANEIWAEKLISPMHRIPAVYRRNEIMSSQTFVVLGCGKRQTAQ